MGLMVSPCAGVSTISIERPRCFTPPPSEVRHSTNRWSAWWPPLVHTLVPWILQPSGTRSPRAFTEARSLPTSGSL